jgi:hypothetical protein
MADLNNPKVQKILHSWDGEYIKFTTTPTRRKYQNIQRDPCVAVSITDVDDPYTYAEFRGLVERIEEDPTGAFHDTLAKHYGAPWGLSWRSACDLIYEDSACYWPEPLGISKRPGQMQPDRPNSHPGTLK